MAPSTAVERTRTIPHVNQEVIRRTAEPSDHGLRPEPGTADRVAHFLVILNCVAMTTSARLTANHEPAMTMLMKKGHTQKVSPS